MFHESDLGRATCEMLRYVPLADGIGCDSGRLALSGEAKRYLAMLLAAVALCISGMRGSYIPDPSQDHPRFFLENGDVGSYPAPFSGGSMTGRPGI